MLAHQDKINKNKGLSHKFSTELVELYEACYLRMHLLVPELRSGIQASESQVAGCLGLHLKLLDKAKYTSTLMLYYEFTDSAEKQAPHTQIRVYHDARIAEALAPQQLYNGYTPIDLSANLRDRWRRNRFLFRWLGYCLHRGHKFVKSPQPSLR